MKTVIADKNGWFANPGNAKLLVVFYEDDHAEPMNIFDFLSLRNKKHAVKIDCSSEND